MTDRILLVLPIQARIFDGGFYIDDQALNGLRLWLREFGNVWLACPAIEGAPPHGYSKVDDLRIKTTPLPLAYKPHRFLLNLPAAITLKRAIGDCRFLHFAIGGLFGDWGSVAAIIARAMGRRFSVWTDRVESEVAKFHAMAGHGLKKKYHLALANLVGRYERRVISLCDVGLFHGMDCYTAYAGLCRNPQIVHDVHLDAGARASKAEIEQRLTGLPDRPLRIVYAGRAHDDKGIRQWALTLGILHVHGFDFEASWYGAGPELEAVKYLVKYSGWGDKISFPGPASSHQEVISHVRRSDIFLFCHQTPESPRCLVEALMCGVPIVGFASPYSQDLIKQNGGGILTGRSLNQLAAAVESAKANISALSEKARLDGLNFDSDAVFRHRSNLIKQAV